MRIDSTTIIRHRNDSGNIAITWENGRMRDVMISSGTTAVLLAATPETHALLSEALQALSLAGEEETEADL